ncbi:CDP-alcohol phosphatidyltransferase family protein [Williamsia herbipolensis]|uniref:Phosphatidylcholine/phosphatidylserine synthase n=1 Tax=Williamsia herbipolensis TaxID=1603258 RepID=A0AAU4JZM9_9NOCA|nr:phosphatidylcholine/phosphatidylserine synthase [Williamsia herbipolensis]MCX6468431.1 phosphatidylcholine/phosphatidylserine synthase [Mycobacteriales bacterium]
MIDARRTSVRSPRRPTGRRGAGRGTTGRRRTLRQSVAHNRSRVPDLGGGRLLVPSALTVLAICAGLSAARFALDGRVDLAVGMIAASALLDGIDGRIARLLGATTKIGAELDSLADAINFGVAPALTLYLLLLRGQDAGWVLALIFVCAVVLRLARFNIIDDDDDVPEYTKNYFVGVPAPAAALIALLPVAAEQQFGTGWWTSLAAVGTWMMLTAALAVSRIPTASLKTYSIPPRAVVGLLILVAICAALLVTFPYLLMFLVIAAYLVHIPFAWRTQRWIASRPHTWDQAPKERRAERRAMRAIDRSRPQKSQARLGLRRPERR